MDTKQIQNIKEECERQGYSFTITKWPRKLTYYKPDGEAMPNLPSDPVTMQRYFNKGFTLKPPEVLSETRGKPEAYPPKEPEQEDAVVNDWEDGKVVSGFMCSYCDKVCKTKAGKFAHERACPAKT